MLDDIRVWQISVPLIAAVVAWSWKEWRKANWENFLRKETYYKALLTRATAFFADGKQDDRQAFIEELRICWLYYPDPVIRKANAFLESFEGTRDGARQKDALRELALTIRKDMLPWYRWTGLEAKDFKLWKA